jgi:hypothetical protein
MTEGRINASLSEEKVSLIKQAVQVIRENMPFLLALSPDERKTMLKAGQKSEGFLNRIATMAREHPELVPPAVDVISFQNDAELFDALGRFSPELTALTESIEDTRMVAGSEAMATGLMLYGIFKQAKRQVAGLDDVLVDVGARFRKTSKKTKKAAAEK